MTYEEFQKIVDEVTGGEYHSPKRKSVNSGHSKGYYAPTTKLKVEWMTGGAWGGNCWDDSEPGNYIPEPQPEPELEQLDLVLEKVCPNITFMQYKVLMQKVTYNTRTENEYYGNHTSYAFKEILVKDIWDFLLEKNFV